MSHTLYRVLRTLDVQKLYYRVDRHRPDSVMITVTVVGERLEIDVFEDGHVEFSRFRGNEAVEGGENELMGLLHELGAEENR